MELGVPLGSGTMQRNDELRNNIGGKYVCWLYDSAIKS